MTVTHIHIRTWSIKVKYSGIEIKLSIQTEFHILCLPKAMLFTFKRQTEKNKINIDAMQGVLVPFLWLGIGSIPITRSCDSLHFTGSNYWEHLFIWTFDYCHNARITSHLASYADILLVCLTIFPWGGKIAKPPKRMSA